MSQTYTETDLNVSLEPHLEASLRALSPLLTPPLSTTLEPYLSTPPPQTIPHSLLSQLSRWTRTDVSKPLLESAGLNLGDYTMLSLLAGTKTSPEKTFPKYDSRVDSPEAIAARERKRVKDERRAITALLNGLLSVGGCAAASWIAAGRVGWSDQWVGIINYSQNLAEKFSSHASYLFFDQKVLLALAVAIIIATAEAGLYMIWNARKSGKLQPPPDFAAQARRLEQRRIEAVTKDSNEKQETDTPTSVLLLEDSPDESAREIRKRVPAATLAADDDAAD
jgi:TMEM199 family protein